MQEKRQHVRVTPEPEEPVEIHLMDYGGEGLRTYDILHAVDISLGGAAIARPRGFEDFIVSGREIDIVVMVPRTRGERMFAGKGLIRRVEARNGKDVFAVEFLNLDERARALLGDYIGERQAVL